MTGRWSRLAKKKIFEIRRLWLEKLEVFLELYEGWLSFSWKTRMFIQNLAGGPSGIKGIYLGFQGVCHEADESKGIRD